MPERRVPCIVRQAGGIDNISNVARGPTFWQSVVVAQAFPYCGPNYPRNLSNFETVGQPRPAIVGFWKRMDLSLVLKSPERR
jgi:hypothetical protein